LGLGREEEKCKLGAKQIGTAEISGGNVGLRAKKGRSSQGDCISRILGKGSYTLYLWLFVYILNVLYMR